MMLSKEAQDLLRLSKTKPKVNKHLTDINKWRSLSYAEREHSEKLGGAHGQKPKRHGMNQVKG